jgi:hypothetical protein
MKVGKVSRKKILTFPEDYTVNADRYGIGILTFHIEAGDCVLDQIFHLVSIQGRKTGY